MSPEHMIARVINGTKIDYSKELWAAFANGFPIENLRPLLTSTTPDTVGLGSYLIYELGSKARPLLDDIITHLDHEDPQIRGNAIVALGACTTKFDTLALGKLVEHLGDPDAFVQRIAIRFIQSCEHSLLMSGVRSAALRNPNSIFEDLSDCLGRTVFRMHKATPISKETICQLVEHKHPVAQRFGVGLATRPRLIIDQNFIDIAANIDDEECRNIVEWAEERPCLPHAELMRL